MSESGDLSMSENERTELTESWAKIDVTEYATLINNNWGNAQATQSVWLDPDGAFGWSFDATGTNAGINYPQVHIGTRPWGDDTGVPEFPIRRRNVCDFTLDVDVESDISGGEWDLAHEWWLMDEKPSVQAKTHQYEVMLLLDWGGGHDHGDPVYTDLWTDEYGNTIDLWALYDSGGTSATFYIFRVQGGHDGGKIDMQKITEWLTDHEGISRELWISGCELGNEYWPEASGETRFSRFDVTINGRTYRSGVDSAGTPGDKTGSETDGSDGTTAPDEGEDGGEDEDTTPPDAPTGLAPASLGVEWDAPSGTGDINHYNVRVNGTKVREVPVGTTAATVSVSDVDDPDVTVTAVDSAGNESDASGQLSVRTESAPSDSSGDSGTDSSEDSGADGDTTTAPTTYHIENVNSGLVLGVADGASGEGASIVQQPRDGSDGRQWELVENDDGTVRIRNVASGLVAAASGSDKGASLVQASWDESQNQRWSVDDVGGGASRLSNVGTGFVADVSGGATDAGADVLQWEWHDADNQTWIVLEVVDGE